MTAPAEIVITGLGVVSPLGLGRSEFRQALLDGRSGVRTISSWDTRSMPVHIGAEVLDFDPKEYVTPRKSLKVMSREIQLAFAAARLASDDARLSPGQVDPDRMGVVLGVDMLYCDVPEMAPAHKSAMPDGNFDYALWCRKIISELHPLWILKYLPNMPACHIAIAHDARGPTNSLTHGEVSSLLALAEAMRAIERGRADIMIAGGVGSRVHPMVWMSRQPDQLSRRQHDPAGASRPFDADRDGMVLGEGAGIFIVESRRHAEARGASILARVLSYSSACEPRPGGRLIRGCAIKETIRQALAAANLAPEEIGHVNAHGLSTIEHDRAEAQAIRQTLGDVPVTAPKSYFGNLGAAGGAVELAVSLLAFESGAVAPTLNYERSDPACPIQVVHDKPWPIDKQTAVVLNQASMGQAAAVVLAGPNA